MITEMKTVEEKEAENKKENKEMIYKMYNNKKGRERERGFITRLPQFFHYKWVFDTLGRSWVSEPYLLTKVPDDEHDTYSASRWSDRLHNIHSILGDLLVVDFLGSCTGVGGRDRT